MLSHLFLQPQTWGILVADLHLHGGSDGFVCGQHGVRPALIDSTSLEADIPMLPIQIWVQIQNAAPTTRAGGFLGTCPSGSNSLLYWKAFQNTFNMPILPAGLLWAVSLQGRKAQVFPASDHQTLLQCGATPPSARAHSLASS